jgi:hypothetical protein
MTLLSDNLVANAGFLRGTTDWIWGSPIAVTARETLQGAKGRAVLYAAGSATAGWSMTSASQLLPAGTTHVEVGAGFATPLGTPDFLVQFMVDAVTPHSLVVVPAVFGGGGLQGVAGLSGFATHWAAIAKPAPATMARIAVIKATTSFVECALLRPAIFAHDSAPTQPTRFDPGVMTAQADLNLPVWPASLSAFIVDGSSWSQNAARAGFETDSGVRRDRRLVNRPRRRFDGALRCDALQADTLMAFERAMHDRDFWMVDPVDNTLCRARFTPDGAPRLLAQQGFTATWGVGLETRLA